MLNEQKTPIQFLLRRHVRVAASGFAGFAALIVLGFAPIAGLAQQRVQIRAAYVPVATWLPVWVAKEKGIFAKNGLDVSLTRFPNVVTLPGSLGKTFDMAPTTAPDFLNAVAGGLNLVAVAGGTVETSANRTFQVMVRPDSGVNSAKDLAGKRIASPGIASVMHVAFNHWLTANGVDPASVTAVEVPFTSMMDQLKAGRIDAAEALQPFVGQMLGAGFKTLGAPLLSVADPVLFPFWIAEANWARANRDVIRRWIASLDEALKLIRSDDKAAREVLAKYTGLPEAVVAKIPYPAYQFTISAEQIEVWQKVLALQGRQFPGLDVRNLVVTAR